MTQTELERLSIVETKLDDIQADIQEIKDSLVCLDKRFASKLTEQIVYGMVGAIALSVLYLILTHVGIK